MKTTVAAMAMATATMKHIQQQTVHPDVSNCLN